MQISKEDYLNMHGIKMRQVTDAEKRRAINQSTRYVLTMPNGVMYYAQHGNLAEIVSAVKYEISR